MASVAFLRVEQPVGHLYPLRKALSKVHCAYQQYGGRHTGAKQPPSDAQTATGLPPLIRLDEFLATPDKEIRYRVDKLWPSKGRVIFAAAWKAGKPTLLGNSSAPSLTRNHSSVGTPCNPLPGSSSTTTNSARTHFGRGCGSKAFVTPPRCI
jgi:hypothetical protein